MTSNQTAAATDLAMGRSHAWTVTVSHRLRIALMTQEVTIAGVIVVFGAVIAIVNPAFVSVGNLVGLLSSTVEYFVVACGLTLVVVAGGFDFSVGSTFTLGGVLATWLMTAANLPWPIAIIGGVAGGFVAGAVNAAVIDRLKVPPIITTLGSFYFISGAVVLFTGGVDIGPLPSTFVALGQGSVASVPNLIIYGLVIGTIYGLVLARTRFGYNVRAVGGNLNAAVANGISVRRTNLWLYAGGAAIASFAGILYAAQTGAGSVNAGGASMTLTAISAVLIGGTSLFGGVGTIPGTFLGSLLFAAINNGLAVANVPALYSSMIIGAILVIAVAVDSFRRGRSLLGFRQK